MFRKPLLILSVTFVLLSSAIAPVSADDPADPPPEVPQSVEGVSLDADRDGRPVGYYLGRTADGFALRTHGPAMRRHHFTAVLRTDGHFVDVEAVHLEPGDAVRVSEDGHTLYLDVHTYDGIDGVNFRVRDGDALRLRLELNGSLIRTSHIYLGAGAGHPATNPFGIRL